MPDIEFALPDPVLNQYTWVLFDEHTPVASPPLTANLFTRGVNSGPEGIPRTLRINGYTYNRQGAGGPSENPFMDGPLPSSVEEMRSWRHEWQPEVDKVVEALREFQPDGVRPGDWRRTLDAQAGEYWRVFGPVHRVAVMPAHAIGRHFQELYTRRFGTERLPDAVALLQGIPNASLERASILWQASRILRAHPGVLAAAESETADGAEAVLEFKACLDELRERFGDTSEGFVEDLPTWSEDSSVPLAVIRAYAGLADGHGPIDSATRQREKRERLEQELVALGKDREVAELLRLLPMAQELLPNLEDHNYYTDQRLSAASRARWLAIGRHLHARGLIDAPDAVFYFERDELILALEGEAPVPKERLARRRDELALWRSLSPPPVLGRPLTRDEAPESTPGTQASEVRIVRGVGVSTGTYRGRARVVDSIAEASDLQVGDVLVTRATTPAWTPFFGVISALVINTGGLLSHAAVVAREFGIPAVAGTVDATVRIPDRATVTVDGANGLVLVEQ